MSVIKLADNLSLPREAVTQTIVVYGGKGMGKTNFGSVLVEELHAARQRFSVIDPMGVWWGLQHGKKKGEPGLEVLLLGGIHGDLPIEPTGGEVVADLVADESISVVIDISRRRDGKAWSKGEKVRFVTAYMTRLYERQVQSRRPLMQVIDEAARYAPQGLRSGDVDEAKCLGAIAMLCEEGRNLGVGMTLLTQRSARLNKDVAELADMLVAFRTVGPNSVGAITDWLGEHVAKERHKAIVEQLRQLPVGSALVISPGWLQFEGIAAIRLRHTFDSSATPKIGATLHAPGKAAKPDLEKYRSRMQETIEKAVANDPKTLKARIHELEVENRKLQQAKPAAAAKETVKEKRVQVPVVPPKAIDRIEKAAGNLAGLLAPVLDGLRAIAARTRQPSPPAPVAQKPMVPLAPKVKPPPRPPIPAHCSNGELDKSARTILIAAYWLKDETPTESKLSFYSGYSPSSSTWDRALGTLRKQYMQKHSITPAGIALVESWGVDPKPAGSKLRDMLRTRLDKAQNAMLDKLIEVWPKRLSSEELGAAVGYSTSSSTWDRSIGKLRSIEAAEGYDRDGGIKAADVFFAEGS
jgi:hypothetical protein